MKKRKLRTFTEVQIEHYTKHPEELKGYISMALEEYQKDGDEKAFLAALSVAARVHGGPGSRTIFKRSPLRFSTFKQFLTALGFSLKIA